MIELKDVISSLGIDAADLDKLTLDEFKTSVGTKYVLRDEVLKDEEIKNKITGTAFGKINTKVAQLFDLKSSEVKDKKLEDILELVKTGYSTKITDLENKVGEGNDKKVTDLTKKVGELETNLAMKETGLKDWEKKFNDEIADREGKLKSYKLNDKISKVKNTLADKFTEEYKKNPLVQGGFESHINSTYVFELDDKDEPVVKLKADNSIVKSKVKIGHSATPDEIFLSEMEAKGVLKKNNADTNKKTHTFVPDTGAQGKSKLHPKFLEKVGGG